MTGKIIDYLFIFVKFLVVALGFPFPIMITWNRLIAEHIDLAKLGFSESSGIAILVFLLAQIAAIGWREIDNDESRTSNVR